MSNEGPGSRLPPKSTSRLLSTMRTTRPGTAQSSSARKPATQAPGSKLRKARRLASTRPPTTRCPEGRLSGLFGDLVVVLGRDRAAHRHERGLEALRDGLLRDHALGDVATRGQLEHHVEERTLDDR